MGLKDLFAAHAAEGAPYEEAAEAHRIRVAGMHCNACEQLVSGALADRGATDVAADHNTGVVTYRGDLSDEAVAQAIAEAGFRLA